jgi:hypothetical protein
MGRDDKTTEPQGTDGFLIDGVTNLYDILVSTDGQGAQQLKTL